MKRESQSSGANLGWLPTAIYLGGCFPAAMLGLDAWRGELGPNPVSEALNQCGDLAVKLLMLSLACTPIKILTGKTWPLRIRKTLGLLSFGYAALHLSIYLAADQRFDWKSVLADITKRPFIAIGMGAFVLLLPLALTSTKRALQRLGARRWRRLHWLVYPAACLVIVHFTMKQKEDISTPVLYGVFLALLFGVRVVSAIFPAKKPVF